jgi:hypothetical protein
MARLAGLRKATTSRRPLRVLIVEDSENDAVLGEECVGLDPPLGMDRARA